jgi:hypothetical protein
MIQLSVLNGSAAGRQLEANAFPISVGRNSACSLVLSEPGVFDKHFDIQFSPEGYTLQAAPHAVVSVNGANLERALLRNGDVIAAGYAKIQFSLGGLKQKALGVREGLTWLLIAAVAAAQVVFVSRLIAMARL